MDHKDVVVANMPKCFRDFYPTTQVIIDATEVYTEKPSLPDLQQMTFSSYKNPNTFKALVGISPSGASTRRLLVLYQRLWSNCTL